MTKAPSLEIKDIARELSLRYGYEYDELNSQTRNKVNFDSLVQYLDQRFENNQPIETIDLF